MNNNRELKWPEFEIMEVENVLGAKALVPGNSADAMAIASSRAERAVQQLSGQFPAWMQAESNRLHTIRLEMANEGPSAEQLDRLYTCAHDIRGQARTLGYPVAGIIGDLLCKLIDHALDPTNIPLTVIDQHVDTIRAIVRQQLTSDGNTQTNNIIHGLDILNSTTLKKISG